MRDWPSDVFFAPLRLCVSYLSSERRNHRRGRFAKHDREVNLAKPPVQLFEAPVEEHRRAKKQRRKDEIALIRVAMPAQPIELRRFRSMSECALAVHEITCRKS